jgi:hypothetical protein
MYFTKNILRLHLIIMLEISLEQIESNNKILRKKK